WAEGEQVAGGVPAGVDQCTMLVGAKTDSEIVWRCGSVFHQRLDQPSWMIPVVLVNACAVDDPVYFHYLLSSAPQRNSCLHGAAVKRSFSESARDHVQAAFRAIAVHPLVDFGGHPVAMRLPVGLQMTEKSSLVGQWKVLPDPVGVGAQGIDHSAPTEILVAEMRDLRTQFLEHQPKIALLPQGRWRGGREPWIMYLRQDASAGHHVDPAS